MDSILEVKNLKKVFTMGGRTPVRAVDDISFSLRSGETLGIVGESGSGKSTIAKLLMRMIPATEGTIYLDQKDITKVQGAKQRDVYRKLQMVFQTPTGSFDPRRTLGDGIGESLKNAGVPLGERKKKVAALLEQCGLTADFADRYPHEVSGGQCQRAAIARALAIDPKIVILDEATSALDVTVQQQIMNLLSQLREERGLSYLFICHNLALVQSFCDRVIVMNDGKIVEQGTAEQVIMHPQSDYTKRLIAAAF